MSDTLVEADIAEETLPEEEEFTPEFVDGLVKKLLLFIQEFCDIEFFPYQTPIAYALVESVVLGDGEEHTVIATRQSGKSEIISNVIAGLMVILPKLAKVYPTYLGKFEKGFYVGVFAPVEEQADTVFGRVVSKLTSERALDFLLDPEIDDRTSSGGARGKGKIISLKNSGSHCRMQTCNPKAKIESKTYHFAVVDEAQEADATMLKKSIKPMLAWNNGTFVMSGTAQRYKSYFYETIQLNKRRQVNSRNGKRFHHEYDWKTAAKYNKNYAQYIAKEKLTIGEDSDEFKMSYCGVGDTPILTSGLHYVRADSVRPGDSLLGFEEIASAPGHHRHLTHAVVEDVAEIVLPCSSITLDDGTVMTFSDDHQWLVQTAGGRTLWKETKSLQESDRIWRIVDDFAGPHEHPYALGYVRAAFDGEGCLEVSNGTVAGVSFAQRDNSMLAEVKRCLDILGFSYETYNYTHSGTNGDVIKLVLRGGRAEWLKFLATVRPSRLLDKFTSLEGTFGAIGKAHTHPRVLSVEHVGDRTVYAIKTTSKTYIAHGLASHNCNQWMLEKGMFVSEDRLERMYDPTMPLHSEWYRTPIVAGIDVARSNDSTVVTAVWVDWDHVDPFGFHEHRVLDWLEINNVEWETQYFQIIDFLRNYNLLRVGVDAQGVGGAVAERLGLLMNYTEVVPVSSDQKAQNDRWTLLTQLIQRDQLFIPGHSKARRTRRWKKFNQQMSDLERQVKGPYMLAAAPDERGAFDDYPDSLAIACAMSIQDTMPEIQVSDSPFYRG